MKVLQINVTANSGSHGRIAEGIGRTAQQSGFDSWIAYGRYANRSTSQLIRIGTKFDQYEHALESRLFDNHGLASRHATVSFLREVDRIKPNLIHLHNIHGYYLNYKILFDYIREKRIPLIWTLHDCWSFTGHCAHFSQNGCNKWETECHKCPQRNEYPASLFLDRSIKNFQQKKSSFNSGRKTTIVSVSQWLDDLVARSFLKDHNHLVIHNGIDTNAFSPSSNVSSVRKKHGILNDETILLGVASVWSNRKGLHDFLELSKNLSPGEKIILIGLSKQQMRQLPSNIIGLERTESIQDLADYYSAADLFLNLTYEDNYPTTNLEAISCGTPCLTYQTGGSAESITMEVGFVVEQGDLSSVLKCIGIINRQNKSHFSLQCRKYALDNFQMNDRFRDYIDLYKKTLSL